MGRLGRGFHHTPLASGTRDKDRSLLPPRQEPTIVPARLMPSAPVPWPEPLPAPGHSNVQNLCLLGVGLSAAAAMHANARTTANILDTGLQVFISCFPSFEFIGWFSFDLTFWTQLARPHGAALFGIGGSARNQRALPEQVRCSLMKIMTDARKVGAH
jgi:hypothetical protein